MPHRRRAWAPIIVLLIGLGATLLLTRLASTTVRNSTEREFNELVERTHTSFSNEVQREIQIARATAGMLATPGEVDTQSFQRFVEHIESSDAVSKRAIGWSPRVELGDGSGDKEIFPVFHVEPRSAIALTRRGFDLASMPELKAALSRATATDRAAIAVPLTRQGNWDAVVFFPIYAPTSPSHAERSRGFAFVAFSMGKLLEEALGKNARLLRVQVRDAQNNPDSRRWTVAGGDAGEGKLRANRALEVGGRSWQLAFASTPAFDAGSRGALVYLLLFSGLFVSLVLTAVTWAETRARSRAEEITEKLANSDEELRRASRAKDEFLAMLGHELRNPLGAIANAIKVMRMRESTDPVMARALDIADRQVRHQTRLVDDLLDLTRLGAGKIRLDLANLDLNDLARRAAAASRDAIEDHGHTFELKTAPAPVVVRADATRLEQIIYNLLSNSVKYTPSGGRIRLTVERDESNGEAVLRVRDDGVGIELGALENVFKPFFQGSRSEVRSEAGGLGIGLTIVQRLVQGHGGRVEARSEGRGRGTEFTIRLPLSPEPFPVVLPPAATEEETSKRASENESLCVLVVEDSADNREMLRELLNLLGHKVHEADCGSKGVERALSVAPDLILIDIGLPDLDGHEVARRIRASSASHSRLIALTGFGSPEDRRRSLDAGFDDHLVKPLKLQKLLDLLNDIHPSAQRRAAPQAQAEA